MTNFSRLSIVGFLSFCLIFSVSCEANYSPKTQNDKESYSIGQNIGKSMKQQDIEINVDALAQGIRDALSGNSALTEDEIQSVMTEFQTRQVEKQQERMAKLSKTNTEDAIQFLSENKSKPGVITTKSGLQYKVIKRGSGSISPKATDTVVVHYKGTLIDGTEFDSSYKRNQPATFPVNGVIKGWTEALQLMKVGDQFTLYIPANLGYGEQGAGPMIGPNQLLIFEVELKEINPKTVTR